MEQVNNIISYQSRVCPRISDSLENIGEKNWKTWKKILEVSFSNRVETGDGRELIFENRRNYPWFKKTNYAD